MAYAEQTSVSVDRSRTEIERILERYGADAFMYGTDQGKAVIQFRAENRLLKFVIRYPAQTEVALTPTGRPKRDQDAAHQQERRRLWRALALYIKAKLEAVESGIVLFDEVFMPHIVLPDGDTMAEKYVPQIAQAYSDGKVPLALPGLRED